jgi:transglutaminase-like putative cysteine protease
MQDISETMVFHWRAFLSLFQTIILIVGSFAAVQAQDHEFEVSNISPLLLLSNPDVIVRLDETNFIVDNPGKATERIRRAVTIFNQDGREFGRVVVFYDHFRQIKSLRGWLRDAQGKKIRDLKNSDIKDYSAILDFSLYDDNRVRLAELYHNVYPYTVVFEYELSRNGLINLPAWHPQQFVAPVENAGYELNIPFSMNVRYHLHGDVLKPEISEIKGRKIFRWKAEMLPKRQIEAYGPSWIEQAPSVLVASDTFDVAGFPGNMTSWDSFGRWFYKLADGRNVLPPSALSDVQRLTANAVSPREKVQALYKHLQATTRYVSVQLGIGGWQPFDAAYVHQRGYGDCKALSNYMLAMLRAVGVEAYPALIRNGMHEPDVVADFPSNQFNHVIVFAPFEKDTVWLECTSQTTPFGHLGASNEDRNVLVVTADGGKIVRTPRSRSVDNQQIRRAVVAIDASGHGSGEVSTRYTGSQQDHVRNALAHSSPRDRENWLREMIDVPTFQLVNADFSDIEARHADINISFRLEMPRFASRSGSRMFLRPNLMERWSRVPPEVKNRTQPVDLSSAFLDVDSVSYQIPSGYAIEAAPPPASIETPFGSYRAASELRNGVLAYSRRLEILQNRLPAEQYAAYRAFIGDVVKADRAQVVLIRKN